MRYFRSKVKIKLFLFCTLLAYSYLCRKYFPMVVNCRQFYRTYPIANTLRSQLNWSQYRRLIQIDENADLIIKRWEEHFNS